MPLALEGGADNRALPTASVEAIEETWRQYRARGDERLRDRLVIHYMQTHVRRIAERLHATLPRQVDVEDLVQQGYLGLMEAMDRFDVDRDVRFETFSSRRIFGSMRDYLREIDPMPRLARTRVKRLQATIEAYQRRHGRPPSDEELGSALDIPAPKLHKLMSNLAGAMVSYHGSRNESQDEDDGDAMHALADRRRGSPLTNAEKTDLRRWITRGFSRRDRLIIVLYYYEQMTMREIGAALGISESRVSQRLDSILACLRARLSYRGAELEFV
jgi:RNA polymerase sigma factor for flagellar operon FliA